MEMIENVIESDLGAIWNFLTFGQFGQKIHNSATVGRASLKLHKPSSGEVFDHNCARRDSDDVYKDR